MMVLCSNCKKVYERDNIGDYGSPYLCIDCSKKSKSVGKNLLLFVIVLMSILMLQTATAQIQSLGTFEQYECVNLKQICSNCTYVNITSVIYPNSSEALGQVAMTKSGTDYSYSFCNTSTTGKYIVNGKGDLNGVDNVWSYDMEITISGTTPSIVQGILYSVILIFLSGVFILCLFFSITIPMKNERNFEGKVVKINWKKYLKFFLFFMDYVIIIFIIGVIYDISVNYFDTVNAIENLFGILFEWSVGLTLPIFAFTICIIVISWIADNKTQKELTRGLPSR